jgi:hypothetical protein
MVVRLSLGENRDQDRSTVIRSLRRRDGCRLRTRAHGAGTASAAPAGSAADNGAGAGSSGRDTLCRTGAAVAARKAPPCLVPLRAGPAPSPGVAVAVGGTGRYGSGPDGATSRDGRRSGPGDAAGSRSDGSGRPAAERPLIAA